MAAKKSRRNEKAEQKLKGEIARAVFAAAESIGLTDRERMEQLVEQVSQRLRVLRPLPGMEDLVVKEPKIPKISQAEIKAKVEEALAEVSEGGEVLAPERKPPEKPAKLVLTPNAQVVLERRYLAKDGEGRVIETPEEMFRRVARHVASAEAIFNPEADVGHWEETFYQLMTRLEFLPNSPTLMNAGRALGQLSACFVLPVDDSMESIFDAVKYTALIHKSGGGTGFSFSRLRPEKDRVGTTGGVASGPVSFIRAFDTATDVIKQGGMRRGANMAVLEVTHPDILKFVTAKEDPNMLTNFNLSVAVTEDFMEKVIKGEEYELINPRTGQAVGRLNARQVFDKIVEMAWRNGDPGLVFLDRMNRANPTPHLGRIESTNPCGEQPLLPFESCNLGSINLSRMLKQEDGKYSVDWKKLERTVKLAVRFLDDVIEVNKFPLPEIEKMTKATRKIGLGVMGFADMLIRLGIPYDSEEALKLVEELMSFIEKKATRASVELAKERGVFPAFKGSIYDRKGAPRVRNATRTTIAPTGTLSIIAGTSSGIEPLFALVYWRHILEGERLLEVNPLFEEVARREGFYSEELMRTLAERGRVRGLKEVPEWVQRLFPTAHDIAPEWHVKMQAAFQKYTDNAVSKTVNLPYEATQEDVARIYLLAYKEGLKGITIYRDRSRETQVLATAAKREEEKLSPRERPAVIRGVTQRVTTGCGNLYVTVNFDDQGNIFEVFSSLGKAGGCASAQLEAISRLCSLALRSGIGVESLVKQLKGIRCPSIGWDHGHAVLSCADAISSVLEKYIKEEMPAEEMEMSGNVVGQCPDCGSVLSYQEGCFICPSCGYTKCS